MSAMREPGLYWVRENVAPEEWTTAKLRDDGWWEIFGSHHLFPEETFAAIAERAERHIEDQHEWRAPSGLYEWPFKARFDEKFEDFFRDGGIQQALAALGGVSNSERLLMREILMNAHAAGAEGLSEMLREPPLLQHLCHQILDSRTSSQWPEPQPITDAQENGEQFLVWYAFASAWVVARWGRYSYWEMLVPANPESDSNKPHFLWQEVTHYLPLPPDVKS